MKYEPDKVKGFSDYLPPESLKREKIREIARSIYAIYGFIPIETPIIEFDELMKADLLPTEEEDEAISDRYRLQDRAKRNLGLRYEFTFQLARIFKQNPNIKLPFRRYQIGEVFRDEPIKTGRTRQFTQCDADIVGDSSINAEAEILSLASDILKELNVSNYEIQINNRKLINAIIESVEIKQKRQILRELDKLEKIGEDEVKTNLRKLTTPNQIVTLFKLLEKDFTFFTENAFDGAKEIKELVEKCKDYGLKIKVKPSMVRGLNYYTGNIFEIVIPGKATVMAGGRYDKLVGKFTNAEIPAVGISFSLEALSGICPEEISKLEIKQCPKVVVLSINQDKEAIKIIKKLRKTGVPSVFESGKPSKVLDYANSMSIPYVIFLGELEIKQEKYKIKEMSTGKEDLLSEKQLLKKLSKN